MTPAVSKIAVALMLVAALCAQAVASPEQQVAQGQPRAPAAQAQAAAAATAAPALASTTTAATAAATTAATATATTPAPPLSSSTTSAFATTVSPEESPWLDLAPFRAIDSRAEREGRGKHKLAAALTLGGIYAGFTTWTYFAWYRKHKPLEEYRWGCFFCDGKDGNYKIWSSDGWFGAQRYAGGADKLGHAWATAGLTRGGTEILAQWGGYDRLTSAIISATLAEALFFGVEVKDGFYYEFSFGDLTFNTLGVALGFALSVSPRLDELIDFRVEYWPSDHYRAQFKEGNTGKNLNIAEDYTGETYLLALHLGGIRTLRESRFGTISRFVDVVAGFNARGYKPEPPKGAEKYKESQHMFIGLSLNAQGVFDYLLEGRSKPARKITHGFFEVFNAPFTSLPVLDRTKRPSKPVEGGGA